MLFSPNSSTSCHEKLCHEKAVAAVRTSLRFQSLRHCDVVPDPFHPMACPPARRPVLGFLPPEDGRHASASSHAGVLPALLLLPAHGRCPEPLVRTFSRRGFLLVLLSCVLRASVRGRWRVDMVCFPSAWSTDVMESLCHALLRAR